ncbi:Hydrophobic protein LTI6B [Platanthera guangdongensis]|uniref:Hydrophobic protein LTI6B n=2 Tax=Embryophyta TaxID=3193 RepID=A0ABR2LG04_9ASPA
MAGTANCIDIIIAILLPPLGVFLKFGCHVVSLLSLIQLFNLALSEFWICLLLTILGYIPGIIYAIYAITK